MTKMETTAVPPLDIFTCPLAGVANIEASAGTGKTWAICGLYLRLLVEAGHTVDQILVVTFTNAATAELRNRIRDRLVEVLQAMETGGGGGGGGDPFSMNFLRRIETLGGEAAAQARNRLQTALLSFEEAAIFTIHSFCQRALGEVPFAAVQPFQLEVEVDDEEMIRETAADCWRRITARYDGDALNVFMEAGLGPEWFVREFRRVLDKPTARRLFPARLSGEDRHARRVACIQRVLLHFGPRAIRAAKRRRRVISYHDMLYNLYEALTGGRLPWLADALRSRFPAALIDEFQDTDPLQFAIFHALYFGPGTIFLVGDPKQAIYSFRNADLHTYLAAKRHAERQWTLRENQRSVPGLIAAVNAVFGANRNVFCSPEIKYQPVSMGTKPRRELHGDPETRFPLSVWLLPTGEKNAPLKVREAGQLALEAMAGEMSRLLAGGKTGRIKIGDEPLQPRDIAVLVRTREQGRIVKLHLARYGIGSVDITDRSVFATLEAEEMERILRAVAEPSDTGLVRAALATVLMGWGSRELAGLDGDDAAGNRIVERMDQYRRRWQQDGFGAMWRRLMAEEQIAERLLLLPDGERRLTNTMHLLELMAAAEERQQGVEELIRWLAERRAVPGEEEAAQLRLESDENLVQIVTKHRAKGLEWPIVFCPFIWKERGSVRSDGRVAAYHDGDRLILDYTGAREGKELQEEENRAERVRLIYVALTRAVNRCYLAAGPFWQASGRGATEKAAQRSIMNWIVAGNGDNPGIWAAAGKAGVAAICQSWHNLIKTAPGIGLVPWPEEAVLPLPAAASGATYTARKINRLPGIAWKLASYSSLSTSYREEDGRREPEERDYDVVLPVEEDRAGDEPPVTHREIPAMDILNFPAGITAGHCLHRVFERIDFQDTSRWDQEIAAALAAYPPLATRGNGSEPAAMIRSMLGDVLTATLPGGFSLRDVPRKSCISELEFAYPVAGLDPGRLNSLLKRHSRRVPELAFGELAGYLRGFIDLVFAHRGKWYVLDWKSNYLGSQPEDYSRARLTETMFHHAYGLQAMIYLTALHRYLKKRLPGYDYDLHIGGILYLFVRGVRPSWPAAGIWHDLPPREMMAALDTLFSTAAGKGDAGP